MIFQSNIPYQVPPPYFFPFIVNTQESYFIVSVFISLYSVNSSTNSYLNSVYHSKTVVVIRIINDLYMIKSNRYFSSLYLLNNIWHYAPCHLSRKTLLPLVLTPTTPDFLPTSINAHLIQLVSFSLPLNLTEALS